MSPIVRQGSLPVALLTPVVPVIQVVPVINASAVPPPRAPSVAYAVAIPPPLPVRRKQRDAAPEVSKLAAGTAVVVKGLVRMVHLNGMRGVCQCLNPENGRWVVLLQTGHLDNFKPDNLIATAAPGQAALLDVIARYLNGQAGLASLGRVHDVLDFSQARKLGTGSKSDVFEAKDRSSQQLVVVKIVSIRRPGVDEARLKREVQVMRQLQHPNIIGFVNLLAMLEPLGGIDSPPPYLCIVMEHVPDSTPLSMVIRKKAQRPELAACVIQQLSRALGAMHDKGLVHRDVWPDNVLVSKQGRILLLDLGSAEPFTNGPNPSPSNLNVPYMSPQASQGERQHPGDDCWSLGLLLTEIVTGSFVSDRLGRHDVAIQTVPAALHHALSETLSLVKPEFGNIIRGLLSQMPDQRTNALSLARVLATSLERESYGAHRASSARTHGRMMPYVAVLSRPHVPRALGFVRREIRRVNHLSLASAWGLCAASVGVWPASF